MSFLVRYEHCHYEYLIAAIAISELILLFVSVLLEQWGG